MDFTERLRQALLKTAWPMDMPRPYSAFHLSFALCGTMAACLLAFLAAGTFRRSGSVSRRGQKTLFLCGILLAAMEIYKQLFLYYIVNGGWYDWWYFPFQLCSVPMYLCLLFPWCGSFRVRTAFAVFIQDFGLLGGFMALLVPPGLMYPYWTLTLHSFLWHFILIFAGCFCAWSGLSDRSVRGYFKALPLFFLCCLAALLINLLAGPDANADMFYISPYHPSSQPVFHRISECLGTAWGIVLYLCSMVSGGFLIHCLQSLGGKKSPGL